MLWLPKIQAGRFFSYFNREWPRTFLAELVTTDIKIPPLEIDHFNTVSNQSLFPNVYQQHFSLFCLQYQTDYNCNLCCFVKDLLNSE
jgi:hypothetical protein